MRELLSTFYAIQISEEVFVEDKRGYKSGDNIFFIITATNNKEIHMEQSLLAYYLVENGHGQIAFPIPNQYGDWITSYRNENYMILKLNEWQDRLQLDHGKTLAQFHEGNSTYAFEPQHISSYGQWKKLWIDKLTIFENKIHEESKIINNDYYRLLVDILPYIVGISENAIQYMQENEQELRHDESDQGTITFQRYQDQLLRPVIWHTDLVYDHPTRDLAEFIRHYFMQKGEQSFDDIRLFLQEYQSLRPLTIFSWRLIYARLIFPTHIFDLLEHAFVEQDYDRHFQQLQQLLDRQSIYQQCLKAFFQKIDLDYRGLQIPVLQWL